MAKFNVVQKRRRNAIAERKRLVHGDPLTGKLRQKPQPLSTSGKRKRKLLKKLKRDRKEAVEKGLITMEDVEMAAADGSSRDANKNPVKFPMKKNKKLRIKQLKKKGTNKRKSQEQHGEALTDAMME